jgi:c-di-GMP-binding flagellar brake protein YcgR
MTENTINIAHIEEVIEEIFNETGGLSVNKGKVLQLIRPGIFIKSQVSNSFRWSVSTILDIKGDMITLPFTKDDANSALLANDALRFRFGIGRYDINFLCTVRDIEYNMYPTKVVKVLKVEIWKNKRGSTRHNAGFVCKAVSEIDEEFMSYLVNISDTGGGLICKQNLRVGSNIRLSFLSPSGMKISLKATAVRCRKNYDSKYEYGLRFSNIGFEAEQRILEILELEKRVENTLYQEICEVYGVTPVC